MTTEHDRLTGQLASVLTGALGEGVEICAVERLKGGYSRRMWAFESTGVRSGTACWILCTDADDGVVGAHSLSRHREARLLDYVYRAGLPVPAIVASGDGPEPFGAAWFVMQRLSGIATVGPLLRDPEISAMRTTLGHQKAGLLARIHALAVPDDVLGPLPAPERIAVIETHRWAEALTETPGAQT
ncbi:MAG: hypothetical protein QOJ09_431, partial [Actinomycetota bacterium]|nr:hypothetical protein [Actinomycetota bacterium]